MSKNNHKMPPIGIEPKYIWKSKRVIALFDAIERYAREGEPIPVEWIEELREHLIIKADESPQYGTDAKAVCGTPPLPPVGRLPPKGTQEVKYY